MMKVLVLFAFTLVSYGAFAESPCDLGPGTSIGVPVIQFTTGNKVHSKIPLRESTADALLEEMISLQDMGVCTEKIPKERCILKFEKRYKRNFISLYRGKVRWNSWSLKSKKRAQSYVIELKRVGFCS